MTEHDHADGDTTGDGIPRRGALRTMAATIAAGPFTGCSSCLSNFNAPEPSGQTVVYKTPQDELRTGTLGQEIKTSPNPHWQTTVQNERSITHVSNHQGRVALSPDTNEVAYIERQGSNPNKGTHIVIRPLGGGNAQRYSRTDLANYLTGGTYRYGRDIELGNIQTLAWCPTGGSSRLAVNIQGGGEDAFPMLVEFDRTANATTVLSDVMNRKFPGMAWSPSCDEIVYKQEHTGGASSQATTDLAVLDLGTNKHTRHISNGRDPAWGNTGIAFVRGGDIYLHRSGSSVQLTSTNQTEINLVFFEQQNGESLAFWRGSPPKLHLIERLDQKVPFGPNPNPSPTEVTTNKPPAPFDIGCAPSANC